MSTPESRRVVQFVAPRTVDVVSESMPPLEPGEVLVDTTLTAVSAGTELLVYRGEAPASLTADASIEALDGELQFPLTYGYAAVGRVGEVGAEVDDDWLGKRVFSFQPHASCFTARPETLVPLPDAVSDEDGVLIPSVETAVSLVMDGRPMIGERVLVFGQGVIGLLTTALLSEYPLANLYTVEPDPERRDFSTTLGADHSFDPSQESALRKALKVRHPEAQDAGTGEYEGADLIYELSKRPSVLDTAITLAGFDARIVVGSWYGTKTAPLSLGERFHRARVDVMSSQVSSIAPEHRGRWSKDRRMEQVLSLLSTLEPSRLITHDVPPANASSLYRSLDEEEGGGILQPVFRYQ